MNLVLSLFACFAAVQAGALAVCIGIMTLDSGLLSVLEGVSVRAIAQPVILPIALLFSPVGALLRMFLGFMFEQPAKVAMTGGVAVANIRAAVFAYSTKDGAAAWVSIFFDWFCRRVLRRSHMVADRKALLGSPQYRGTGIGCSAKGLRYNRTEMNCAINPRIQPDTP